MQLNVAQAKCVAAPRVQCARLQGRLRRCAVRRYALGEGTVLVGDIGGTNARLSLWSTANGTKPGEELFHKTFPTKDYNFFEDVVDLFLKDEHVKGRVPRGAAFAVAGAVEDNVCDMTNLKWVINGNKLQDQLRFKVAVLNDFEAQGYGILQLKEEDLVVVNDFKPKPKSPKVVMGPGTGLGAGQILWSHTKQAYKVVPGEGAHCTFAPRGWKQLALSQYVTTKYEHCEIEQVACGRGIETIYEFLLSDEYCNRPGLLPAKMKSAPEISSSALDESDPIAVEAIDMFLAIVGAEAGQMALRCLAKGGVYICGGIMPRLLKRIQLGGFLDAFIMSGKGRDLFCDILRNTPVFIVTNTKTGLLGTYAYACEISA